MSEVVVTPAPPTIVLGADGKPAAGAPVVTPPVAPATPAAPSGEPAEKPLWLDARLERERRGVLKDLGVENIEDAKKSLGELNAKREAEKTAAQKATELAASLKSTTAEKNAMAEALKGYATAQLATLTDGQRAAVAAVAGDDPAKQLKAIEALSPTWKGAPTTPAAPAVPAAPAKPADTAPAGGAPKDTTTSPPDPKAVYAELKKTNPVIAARFAIANKIFDQ